MLVFGESRNDADSVAELVRGANPALEVAVRLRPPSLTRDAGRAAVQTWISAIERTVRADRTNRDVRAVVVHRDADGPDGEGSRESQLLDQLAGLRQHVSSVVVAAVPVEMIEAWWFLFPDAVEAVNPVAWKGVMPKRARDVEMIRGPKTELMRVTRKGRGREYSEGDSPAIARSIVASGAEPLGRSASYERLRAAAAAL